MNALTFALEGIANLTFLHRCHVIYSLLLVGWMLICCADAKSDILLNGPENGWFTSSGAVSSQIGSWYVYQANQYSVCDTSTTDREPTNWLRTGFIDVKDAIRVDIVVNYTVRKCKPGKMYCKEYFKLYGYETSTTTPKPNPMNTQFDFLAKAEPTTIPDRHQGPEDFNIMKVSIKARDKGLYLAFYDQGSCLSLLKILVSFNYCPGKSNNLVKFVRTVAPFNDSSANQIEGKCHDRHSKNTTELTAVCMSQGSWKVNDSVRCLCQSGYEYSEDPKPHCSKCPVHTYKNRVGNSNCTACPRNSIQDASGTSCYCYTGFYRTEEENEFSNCSRQPSAPQNLAVAFLNASFVSVTWNPPSDDGGRSDVYYTVECYQCSEEGTDCTRGCAGSDINVDQNSRRASINSLSAYTYYQLKVYAKNGVSKLAEKNKEKANHADVKFQTKNSIPGSPVVTVKQLSPTSVLLSWEVRENKGIITYYQVSYYPVNQPSNVKKFNTTFTSATITGLKTGKEYRFEVRASSRLGLGPPGSQTKDVVTYTGDKPNIDVTVPVLGALIGILFLIVAVVVIVYFVRRERRTSSPNDEKQTDEFANHGDNIPMSLLQTSRSNVQESKSPNLCEDLYAAAITDDTLWEIPRENISIIKRLGSGNFGYVDKALAIGLPGLPGQVMVAVKSLKEDVKDKDREDFLTELNLMMKLAPHRHVVRLYGCCTKAGGPQSIILEYLPYGDLLGYLRRSRGHEDSYCSGDLRPESSLKSKDLLKFGWMIADGMEFLAENKCVHRDLAARNVLVGENKVCKISDLGLARKISEDIYTRSSAARLPVKWMPPESLFFGQSTIASDVWSYGIVLWELFTLGDSPYPGCKGKDVPRLLREGYRMPKPAHLSETLYSLMMRCWYERPEDRPPFSLICEEVNTYYKATEDYINLEVFDDRLYVNFDVL